MNKDKELILNRIRLAKLQSEYCKEHGYPNFASTGQCYRCGANVYDDYTLKEVTTRVITYCKRCNYSFV